MSLSTRLPVMPASRSPSAIACHVRVILGSANTRQPTVASIAKIVKTIVTSDLAAAERFAAEVDAAAVLVNASSRFVDGGEFGFGAEIGISTQKLHARGPMALPELTSTKWIVEGDGHTRI